jgi:probable F420-dependent oxidoreductase
MRFGVVFPQLEIGEDPAAIRDYAQAVEGMGYRHLLAYDHVLGASIAHRPDWSGPYTSDSAFLEPLVLFSYLAAFTRNIELVTGVLILPQRQTALVAKQAATLDVLCGGRLRLGIGIGWNTVEYDALNEDFHDRGLRSEEQIAVLRALWTQQVVTFQGRWHHIDEAGIKPLPVQRPIPIWIGGEAKIVLKRISRIGDGWFPWFPPRPPDDAMRVSLESLRADIQAAGRPPDAVGIEARLSLNQTPESEWGSYAESWRSAGATHLDINTMGLGLPSPQAHIDMLHRVKNVLGV